MSALFKLLSKDSDKAHPKDKQQIETFNQLVETYHQQRKEHNEVIHAINNQTASFLLRFFYPPAKKSKGASLLELMQNEYDHVTATNAINGRPFQGKLSLLEKARQMGVEQLLNTLTQLKSLIETDPKFFENRFQYSLSKTALDKTQRLADRLTLTAWTMGILAAALALVGLITASVVAVFFIFPALMAFMLSTIVDDFDAQAREQAKTLATLNSQSDAHSRVVAVSALPVEVPMMPAPVTRRADFLDELFPSAPNNAAV